MTLQDLIENIRKYTLLNKNDVYLFENDYFKICMYTQTNGEKLSFYILNRYGLELCSLVIKIENNNDTFKWIDKNDWLKSYVNKLPNMCTYLTYSYIFSCMIKINESKNRR